VTAKNRNSKWVNGSQDLERKMEDHSSIPIRFVPSLPLHGEKSKVREIAEESMRHGSVRRLRGTCRTENKFLAASFNKIFY
jgi:hypothetical protein